MSAQEKGDVLTQTIENARETLRGPKKEWKKEYTSDESGPLIRAILAQTQGVKNPGMVTVVIEGGENGIDHVRALVTLAGVEGRRMMVPFKIKTARLELRNMPGYEQAGQERIQTMANIFTDPATIAGRDVAVGFTDTIGDGKINIVIGEDVLGAKLNSGSKPVRLKTYGIGLTERNTLLINLTA